MTKPTSSPIDITNQKRGEMGLFVDSTCCLSVITVGTIPAISRFIDSNSGTNVLVSARRHEPPAMSRMNRDWKIIQPRVNPRMYSTITSVIPARPRMPESQDHAVQHRKPHCAAGLVPLQLVGHRVVRTDRPLRPSQKQVARQTACPDSFDSASDRNLPANFDDRIHRQPKVLGQMGRVAL